MKPESKFWKEVRKVTPNISWERVESSSTFGFPDLVGFHKNYGFFTLELKVTKSKKVLLRPHQNQWCVTHPFNHWILVKVHDRSHWELYEAGLAVRINQEGLLPHDTAGLYRLTACELEPLLERLLADRLERLLADRLERLRLAQ